METKERETERELEGGRGAAKTENEYTDMMVDLLDTHNVLP